MRLQFGRVCRLIVGARIFGIQDNITIEFNPALNLSESTLFCQELIILSQLNGQE